jgi:Na+/proline symporter
MRVLKKRLETRIRGWLPKEPSLPNPQKTKIVEVNQKTKNPTKTRLAMFCIGLFAVLFITFTILQGLGLESYSPFAAGAVGALAAAVLSVLLWKPRNQSSKPSEMKNEAKTEGERKALKIFVVANATMLGIFLVTYFLIDPINSNSELTLVYWIALVASFFLINRLLIRNYQKQTKMIE